MTVKTLRVEKEKIEVIIFTPHHKIEGTIYLYPSSRLTDFMNVTTAFIPVTDAKIYALTDDRLLFSGNFLNINKNNITMIFPKDAVADEQTIDPDRTF